MDRTWAANVGNISPAVPSSFAIGYPQEGDVNAGTEATKPGLWWFHMMTEEVRNVLISAGLQPSAANTNQLAAAIVQIANAAAVSITGSLSTLDPTAYAQLVAASAASTTALAQAASAVSTATAAQATANSAASAVTTAQTDATAALVQLSNIASDSILSAGEKPQVILDYNTLIAEQSGIDAQATAYSITTEKTAYDNAVSSLTAYLATLTAPVLWSNLTGNTTIVGTTFRTNFQAVYTTRQTLLNKIYALAQALANTAQSAANTAQTTATNAATAAGTALTNANNAQTSANSALSQLTNIASDSILSPSEKPQVVQAYNTIIAEQGGIDAQATAYFITTDKTTYDNAVAALTAYLGGLSGWNTVPGGDVAIVGTTFRAAFQTVYTTKQALLNTISAVAGTLAQWANVTGSNKPANNASADITLIPRGNCVVTGNVVTKAGGASAWDSDAYSKESYGGGCAVSAVIGNSECMFGLNTDPAADASYASLDFAFYIQTASNALAIYESGVSRGNFATWAAGDYLSITYDGVNVRYYQNNTLLRIVAATVSVPFFWDSSFATPSSALTNCRIAPMSPVTNINTPQIVPGAVNGSSIAQNSGTTLVPTQAAAASLGGTMNGPSLTTVGGNVFIAISGSVLVALSGTAQKLFFTSVTLALYQGATFIKSLSNSGDSKSVAGTTQPGFDISTSGLLTGIPAGTYQLRCSVFVSCVENSTGGAAYMTRLLTSADWSFLEYKV